jgi:Phage Tail Collar Domain
MTQRPDGDVQAELDDLRRRLGALETKHLDLLRRARRSRRAGFGRKAFLGMLSVAGMLAAGGLLHGQAGDALFIDPSGRVGIGTTNPLGKLDIQAGADSNGNNDPQALSFSYRTGGYRHWLRTRHNSVIGSGNAIDFFVNSSSTADGSKSPGVGSVHVMTLDSGNVGIGKTNPKAKLEVAGTVSAEGFTTVSGVSLTGVQNAVNMQVPIGTIMAYGGNTGDRSVVDQLRKQGWLPCDGATVSRKEFGELFQAIGTAFGAGDATTTFQVPDMRGRFLRGTDQGQKRDPDSAIRRAEPGGGNSGDRVGSVQDDTFGRHSHGYNSFPHSRGGIASGSYWQGGGAQTAPAGGNETRPKNINVNWIIKAKHLLALVP